MKTIDRDKVQSVERAIDLLLCFSVQKPELKLNDFIEKTNLKRTTVYRLLSSLQSKGMLMKNEENGTYKLGLPFIGFAQIVSENLDMRQEALPVMKKLADETKETVSLNVIQATRRICVEKVDGIEDIRQFIKLGFPYPILKGASGKLLLAYASDFFVKEVVHEWETSSNEIIDLSRLKEELALIRDQGYAFSMNERVMGAFAISTPIFGVNDQILGGLSISGLSIRLTEEKKRSFIEKALDATKEISRKMGAIQ